MKLLKALLTLTVSTVCSYAASKHSNVLDVNITVTHVGHRSASVQPEITQEMKTTAFSLAHIEGVCEDLSVAGSVNRDVLCAKLNTALQLLMMINKTHSYDTTAIVEVASRIKNDWHISEGEKSEWAELLRTSSRALDDNLSINLKSITTAIVRIEDIAKYLENSSVSVDRDLWATRLDNATLLLQTMDGLDLRCMNDIAWVKGRIQNDMYISTDERREWAGKLKEVLSYLNTQITH